MICNDLDLTNLKTAKTGQEPLSSGWLMVTNHVQKVMGSNPGAIYWMDLDIFSH